MVALPDYVVHYNSAPETENNPPDYCDGHYAILIGGFYTAHEEGHVCEILPPDYPDHKPSYIFHCYDKEGEQFVHQWSSFVYQHDDGVLYKIWDSENCAFITLNGEKRDYIELFMRVVP